MSARRIVWPPRSLNVPWSSQAEFMTKYAPHTLYRCYDADGLLLYIGCTGYSVESRIAGHRDSKRAVASILLQHFMARYEGDADTYRGRLAGRRAEAAAIRAERPLFNLCHTGIPTWMRGAEIASYLHEHVGRWPATYVDADGFDTGLYLLDADLLTAYFAQERAA